MRIKAFKCEACGADFEEIYTSDETIPDEIPCEKCDKGIMMPTWDIKKNPHKWHYMDALS